MSKAKKMKAMPVWVVLNQERYIKKSILDGSFAVFDEQELAIYQAVKINHFNKEVVFTEEALICNKKKFSEYAQVHDEMYEMLERIQELLSDDDDKHDLEWLEMHTGSIQELLAKA